MHHPYKSCLTVYSCSYALMYSCWEEQSENRPTFEELHRILAKIVEEEEENMTPEYLKLI